MSFSRELLSILVLVAIGLGLLALFLLSTVAPRRRLDGAGVSPGDRADVTLEEHARVLNQIRGNLQTLKEQDAALRQHLSGVVQQVGLIRYDAFDDMGGRLSFSLALLDEHGDGVVVTSINGRQDTRVYAKPVTKGTSSHNLSDEETAAIAQATAGQPAAPA